MAQIVPSILEDTLEDFQVKVASVLAIPDVSRGQVDISDGKFTPRTTVALADIEPLNPAYEWELHLMCEDPEPYFLDAKIAGFGTLLLPFEVVHDRAQLAVLAGKLRELKISPGLSVNPETSIADIEPYLGAFDQVLLLSVHPGYQGQKFIEGTQQKVAQLRRAAKNVKLEVDGGVDEGDAASLEAAGADYLVVGSALFRGTSPAEEFEKIEADAS